MDDEIRQEIEKERNEALQQIESWLELPMVLLGFAWLALTVVELLQGLSPLLEAFSRAIWVAFILEFVLRITLAPRKLAYVRRNFITVIALVIPALRVVRIVAVLRVIRIARVARGLRLVRVVTSLNRGMRSLSASMSRRGFGYAVLLTTFVVVAGAAGMFAFERGGTSGIDSYGMALWSTAMLMTSIGTDYWPESPEGRILSFLLSLYGLGVFGYLTATIATFFIGQDAESEHEIAGARLIHELRKDVAAMRADMEALRKTGEGGKDGRAPD